MKTTDNTLYVIMRYSQEGAPRRVRGFPPMSIEAARRVCSDPKTRGGNSKKGTAWFYGFTRA